MGKAYRPKPCERCGANFSPRSPVAKFCDPCRPQHAKEWRSAYSSSRYANDATYRDDVARRAKEWQAANPDRRREIVKESDKRRRPASLLAQRRRRAANPERHRAQDRKAKAARRERKLLADLTNLLTQQEQQA